MAEKIQIEKIEEKVIEVFSEHTIFRYEPIKLVYLASGKSFDRTLAGLKIAQRWCIDLSDIVECLR